MPELVVKGETTDDISSMLELFYFLHMQLKEYAQN